MNNKKYNEKYYLNDSNLISSFQNDSFLRKEKRNIEEREYKDIIKEYDLLINRLANFIKKMGYNNSIDCSLILSYMIGSGFVSFNCNYLAKEMTSDKELSSRLGITIVRGRGVCRNLAAMHKDVFDILCLSDKKFYCYQGFWSGKRQKANHVINLISYDGNYYGIDIYNGNRLYRFINEYVMREIGLCGNNILRYKPYYELLTGESSIEDIKKNLEEYKICSKKERISSFTYADMRFTANNRINSAKDNMFDFYHDNERLIKKINNGLL